MIRAFVLLATGLDLVSATFRERSFGGLHEGRAAVARRAAFLAELATNPTTALVSGCDFAHATNGYWESCGGAGGNLGSFDGLTVEAAGAFCCSNSSCAGFSFGCTDADCSLGGGYYKRNVDCGFVPSADQGFAKPSALPILPNVSVVVAPSTPLADDATSVVVTFAFASGAPNATTDWIGQVCEGYPIEDYLEYAPVSFFAGWASGRGTFEFPVFRSRCNFEFRYFRGKQPLWPSGSVLGVSNLVRWAGSWALAPYHGHVAFGGPDTQHSMVVSFSTNSTPASVTVMVGTASGVYNLPNATDLESTTYGPGDVCEAPANTTSVDYWQWPGVFHHARLHNLQAGTRYFVRPVADGVISADEITFVTGKALGPSVPVTFAAYGDMSATDFVLVGDTTKEISQNGGPGAVGTSTRLRQRIDASGDIDFVTHFGDLGYAKGAIFLWDAWMTMMSNVGARVPYMVSIGNHEYDYHAPSPNDPSGVPAMWRPSWWDGDVDSLGECGVGTDQRFRGPTNGNRIFWYSFATGSVTVVMLSSEHDLAAGSAQGEFLVATLSAVNRSLTPWVVVTLHRDMYSLTGAEQAQQDGFRALLEPVFMRFGVDLVLMGHLHSSQRTCPLFNNTCTPGAPVYVISGSSGAMLSYNSLQPSPLVEFYNDVSCGFYVVSIANASHLRLTWSRNNDSAVLDDSWIVKGP